LNKVLSSYAMLMVDTDHDKSFVDYFVPFICECIYQSPEEVVSIDNIKQSMVDRFGIDIPYYVVSSILKKRLDPKKLITKQGNVYHPNRDQLKDYSFREKSDQALFAYQDLINHLTDYVSQKFDKEWTFEKAEEYVEEFLGSNRYEMMDLEDHSELTYKDTEEDYIISSFILFLDSHHSPHIQTILSLVKGDMIADAMYLTDLEHLDMKFKNNTQLFFDTTFIIYALGLSGEARQNPCTELLNLLREEKAILRCFSHTVDEVRGVLDRCKKNLSEGNFVDSFGTTNHLKNSDYSLSEVEFLIATIDDEIEQKLNIKIIDKPVFNDKVIDVSNLKARLAKINYSKEGAFNRDVSTMLSILSIRNFFTTQYIENCKALFVTTNDSLVRETANAMDHSNERIIPPALTANMLMNLLWLKRPTQTPDLPRKRIVADCYAALQPPEFMWRKYIQMIDKLKEQQEISTEKYNILRYSQESPRILMDKTAGDEEALVYGTIDEILSEAEMVITQDLRNEKHDLQEQSNRLKEDLNESMRQASITEETVNNNVDKFASMCATGSTWLLTSILALISYFMLAANNKIIAVTSSIVLAILSLFGFNLLPWLKHFKSNVKTSIYHKTLRFLRQ